MGIQKWTHLEETFQRYWSEKSHKTEVFYNVACFHDKSWLTLTTSNHSCQLYSKTFSQSFFIIIKTRRGGTITFKTYCKIKWASKSALNERRFFYKSSSILCVHTINDHNPINKRTYFALLFFQKQAWILNIVEPRITFNSFFCLKVIEISNIKSNKNIYYVD